jgi:LPS-assembly protein
MRPPAPRTARPVLSPVAAVVLLAYCGTGLAQTEVDAPLVLKRTPMLAETVPSEIRKQLPTFITGDSVTGRADLETVIEGAAEMRRGDTVIRADRIEYSQPDDLVKGNGNVRINRAGNIYEGESMELKVEAFEGFFNKPKYQFLRNDSYGEADRIDFIDDKRSIVRNASLTTCKRQPGPDWMPAWVLKATSINFDYDEDVGRAEDAVLRFQNVPILPFPDISFPLSEKRKSGFLPPTIAIDNLSGLDLVLPYYWNIAPNRDLTLYPELLARRGIDLGAEFRYLEAGYNGVLRGDFMPNDTLRDRSRWGLSYQHTGGVETGLPSFGPVAINLNINRVSDDNYWRDFPRATGSLTQRLLASDFNANWNIGNFANSVRTLKWQTLQDVTAPITPPYDRLPQLNTKYNRSDIGGFDFSFEGDYTRFVSDRILTGQPNGNRTFALGQVSYPLVSPGWFIVPKAQLHATSYTFDAPLINGRTSASRTLPTLSLDSGLILERKTSFFGRNFVQTLEPRAFYSYTPFRDQSFLPNYDSASNDFNFATVYTENAFGGNDRISDNNLLTLGVTTRLLNPETGAEAARFGIAQRLRFKDQNVTLPGGVPQVDRISDLLAGAGVSFDPRWSAEGTVQFNQKTGRSIRSTLGARYSPSNYHVVSAAYRLQRASGSQFPESEQIDVGFQWPLNDLWGDKGQDLGPGRGQGEGRWYGVGRLNYSLQDRKLVDSIIGLEYDAGCWIGRIVAERLQRSGTSANQRIMFQLEFVGFSRLGSNPLKTLKDNIPRYQYLREQTTAPSRFTRYD